MSEELEKQVASLTSATNVLTSLLVSTADRDKAMARDVTEIKNRILDPETGLVHKHNALDTRVGTIEASRGFWYSWFWKIAGGLAVIFIAGSVAMLFASKH